MLNAITHKLASFADHIAAAMMYRKLSCFAAACTDAHHLPAAHSNEKKPEL